MTHPPDKSADVLSPVPEERLRALVAALPGLALVLNQHGVCTEILANNEGLLAADPAITIGHSVQEVLNQEHAQTALDAIKTVIDTRQPSQIEYRVMAPRGPIWLDARLTYIAPSAERPEAAVAWLANDITDRMLAQAQLQKRADELAESNRVLEEFAWLTSHDLQEPLRKILTYGSRLAKFEAIERDEDHKRSLSRVLQSARSMRQLIEDLLSFSQIGRGEQAFVEVKLGDVVDQAIKEQALPSESCLANIHISTLPKVSGDPLQLMQLFHNLISNAIKFRSDQRPLQVHIEAKAGPGQTTICVRDNGIGFDQKYAQRIFGIFKRLHATADYPGTGIGLALCRKIAEFHGGSIHAQANQDGPGAEFRLTLPVKV
ncbi:MAG: ATP-binding protein [Lysobacterales bacterium]